SWAGKHRAGLYAYACTSVGCVQVQQVVTATEMSPPPPAAPAPEAPVCAAGQTVNTLFFGDVEKKGVDRLPSRTDRRFGRGRRGGRRAHLGGRHDLLNLDTTDRGACIRV